MQGNAQRKLPTKTHIFSFLIMGIMGTLLTTATIALSLLAPRFLSNPAIKALFAITSNLLQLCSLDRTVVMDASHLDDIGDW